MPLMPAAIQLITQLLQRVLGQENVSRELARCLPKLEHHKFTSTDEFEVDERYKSMATKLSVKGFDELAEALTKCKTKLLGVAPSHSIQNIHIYDMLVLFLALASTPTTHSMAGLMSAAGITDKQTTWDDVIADEPMQGAHWLQWEDISSEEETDSVHEDFQLDRDQVFRQAARRNRIFESDRDPEHSDYFKSQLQLDNDVDLEALSILEEQQKRWRTNTTLPNERLHGSILQDACLMNPALSQQRTAQHRGLEKIYMDENDVMREVLFVLRGSDGIIFKAELGTKFLTDTRYAVRHLSDASLHSLLHEFCAAGSMLKDLHMRLSNITGNASCQYGQTCQAFALAVINALEEFKDIITKLEAGCALNTHDHASSLLNLKKQVQEPLQCLHAMYDILRQCLTRAPPRSITVNLLATLYHRTLAAQTAGQKCLFRALQCVFQRTLEPFGRLADDWVFYGSLQGDVAREFIVSRQDNIEESDASFWANGFCIQTTGLQLDCPLFDQHFVSRVFFSGKAMCLLSRIQVPHNDADMPNPLGFNSAFSSVFSARPHFFSNEPATVKGARRSPHGSSSFMQASFPLANAREEVTMEMNDDSAQDGRLFDQDVIQSLESFIQIPYQCAANQLATVLQQHCGLSEHLRTLASVFLMLEDDLMHHFCEALFMQMDQKLPWYEKRHLDKLFVDASSLCERRTAFQSINITLDDPSREPLGKKSMSIASYLELIKVDYTIPWPINNLIKQSTLSEYSHITMLLLRLKRAKYVLERKSLPRGNTKLDGSHDLTSFYATRMRMMWFVNAFWRYVMTTVLHTETIKFRNSVALATDADELAELHDDYVRRIVDRCLLNEKSRAIKKAVVHILDLVEQFGEIFVQHIDEQWNAPDRLQDGLRPKVVRIIKDFQHSLDFITRSLTFLGENGGFPWFETLAASLTA